MPTRDSVRPSVKATVVYDDNVFAQPNARGDVVMQVSPLVTAIKADPRRTLTASYGFDAERYDTYSELTAVQARSNAMLSASFRPTPRRRFDLTGGYTSTNNPTELNTTTTLQTARRKSNRWEAGGAFNQELSRRTSFDVSYAGNRDKYGDVTTFSNGVELRVNRHMGTRADMFVRANTRRFDFGQLGGTTISNQVAGGWAWRSRTTQLTIDGGVSRSNTQIDGTATVMLARTIGLTTISGKYERGTTTAVGIPGAIVVDLVDVGFSRQSRLRTTTGVPRGFRYGVHGGVARNELATGEARTFTWSAEIGRPLTSTLLFVTTYEGSTQETLSGIVFGLGGDISRNRLSIGIQFAPWSAR